MLIFADWTVALDRNVPPTTWPMFCSLSNMLCTNPSVQTASITVTPRTATISHRTPIMATRHPFPTRSIHRKWCAPHHHRPSRIPHTTSNKSPRPTPATDQRERAATMIHLAPAASIRPNCIPVWAWMSAWTWPCTAMEFHRKPTCPCNAHKSSGHRPIRHQPLRPPSTFSIHRRCSVPAITIRVAQRIRSPPTFDHLPLPHKHNRPWWTQYGCRPRLLRRRRAPRHPPTIRRTWSSIRRPGVPITRRYGKKKRVSVSGHHRYIHDVTHYIINKIVISNWNWLNFTIHAI